MVTYEELILSHELPESIIIAGAGAIGIEFGYVLKNYGVDVTIVEFLPRALPNEDIDASKEIEERFKKLASRSSPVPRSNRSTTTARWSP